MNELHINKKTMLFEISLDVLTGFSRQIKFKEISKFPSVRRDLSFIVKKSISFDEIKECIVKSSNELLISLNIFDIYEGENIHHSEKSIAIGLIFQNMERTLKDDDIESLVKNIITNMHISFGAYLREN
jgi:phenylalanyl-tRNA synthetase beta chain